MGRGIADIRPVMFQRDANEVPTIDSVDLLAGATAWPRTLRELPLGPAALPRRTAHHHRALALLQSELEEGETPMHYEPIRCGYGVNTFEGVIVVDGKPYVVERRREHDDRSRAYTEVRLVPFVPEDGTLGADEPLPDGSGHPDHNVRYHRLH
jgi:hypothetical protein